MKYFNFLIIIGLVFFFVEYTSERRIGSSNHSVDIHKVVMLDSAFIKNKDKSPLDIFIDTYADSINNMQERRLPLFLDDAQFDYHNIGIYSPFHNPLSLRKLIFDRVDNCKSLKVIINSSRNTLKNKPEIQHGIHIEYSEYSFQDLVQKRFKELKCY